MVSYYQKNPPEVTEVTSPLLYSPHLDIYEKLCSKEEEERVENI